jgi:hypothetical protein
MVLIPCVTFVTIFIRAFIRAMYLYTALWAQLLTFSQNPGNLLQATFYAGQKFEQTFFLIPNHFGVTARGKIGYTGVTWHPGPMVKLSEF